VLAGVAEVAPEDEHRAGDFSPGVEGEALGVPTPANRLLLALVKLLEKNSD